MKTSFNKVKHSLALTLLLSGFGLAPLNAAGSVTVKPWGKTADGKFVELFTLTNKNGMRVSIMTYGATVTNLYSPDRHGKFADVALGFDSLKPYFTQTAYFGAIAGRYANRIANAKFTLDGKTFHLSKNDGTNLLHGGAKGFDKRVWKGEALKSSQPSVRFTRRSTDGEEGFPGNLDVAVTYTLTDRNELRIAYRATTDKPTVVNLTHHTYFNLAGAGNGSILGEAVKIHADRFTPVDKNLIPTGELKKVEGTPLDFRRRAVIGLEIKQAGGKPVGFDHNFALNKCPIMCKTLAAEVYDIGSGRLMKVYTDQPGLQFYSGNFLDGTLTGKGGKVYKQYYGFCLETQHFPDSPNHPNFPSTVLRPGQTYATTTVYQFSAK